MPSSENRIIIVDDEDLLRETMLDLLEDEGFEVKGAATAEEGLEMLTRFQPTAALVDMRLPGMDGNEFIIRAHEILPDLRFIVSTGSVNYRISETLRKIGLTRDSIFHKPVKNLNDLIMALTGKPLST